MKLLLLLPFFLYILTLDNFFDFKLTPPKEFVIQGKAQGTSYFIKYLEKDTIVFPKQIDSILNSIDSSLSLYKSYSTISKFNTTVKCLNIDSHFMNVFNAAYLISESSNGLFDITCKPLSELWGFGQRTSLIGNKPDSSSLKNILNLVGYKKIYLNNNILCKSNKHIKVDCDGIAQGYTVDVISNFLYSNHISNFIVEVGGEIRSAGHTINNTEWSVGIEDPSSAYQDNFLIKRKIKLENRAVTTSGNYRKFKQYGKEYFSHIINPITGYPVNNGIVSVTVIANNATTADGWDNAFMLMGINKAIPKSDSLNQVGLYILYQDENGILKDTCNNFFKNSLH